MILDQKSWKPSPREVIVALLVGLALLSLLQHSPDCLLSCNEPVVSGRCKGGTLGVLTRFSVSWFSPQHQEAAIATTAKQLSITSIDAIKERRGCSYGKQMQYSYAGLVRNTCLYYHVNLTLTGENDHMAHHYAGHVFHRDLRKHQELAHG
eukprot:5595861-Amphidinium_carterae.1